MRRSGREIGAVLTTLAVYEARILPRVRRELASWRRVAGGIPDPVLRETALAALIDKASNVEAVAVFATLAPAAPRPAVIRAIVALQAAIDYLDSLGERPGEDPLRDGLRLHGSLVGAFVAVPEPGDWYAHHPRGEDGGYLDGLLAAAREAAGSLPAIAPVGPFARRAALRCGEGQSHTHAGTTSERTLRDWAGGLTDREGFRWWEAAAGASSSVAAHALIALAAVPGSTPGDAELVDAAYFPAIGALTVLLDDLVDRDEDAEAGEHNYLDYYEGNTIAAARLEAVTAAAREAIAPLPHASRHAAILAGVLAYYLSRPQARTSYGEPIRRRALAAGGAPVSLLASILRLRDNG